MALVGHISGSSQSNSVIGVSGSVIIANRSSALFPALPGTDVAFFVSGSATSDMALFGGGLVSSGSLTVKNAAGANAFTVASATGNTVVQGTLQSVGAFTATGGLTATSITGSITKLAGGGDYLIAGSNITLTTGSNGSVTIASSGGGTPGGATTQIQFNNAGAFAGDADLTYNTTTDTLSGVTGSFYRVVASDEVRANGGSVTTTQTAFNLVNSTATTLNVGGAATAITMGDATSATTTIRGGTLVGNTATQNVFNTTATSVNFAGAGTDINVGSNGAGALYLKNATTNISGASVHAGNATFNANVTLGDAAADTITVNGTTTFAGSTVTTTFAGSGSIAGTLTVGGASTLNGNVTVGDAAADTVTVNGTTTFVGSGVTTTFAGDVAVNGGDITTSAVAFNLVNGTATSVNFAGAGIDINVGSNGAGALYLKNATTNVSGAMVVAGDVAVNGGDMTSNQTTFNLLNSTVTTLNLGGAADVNLGGSAKTVTVAGALSINGNTTLGDINTDTITFTARAASSFLPSADVTYDLGSSQRRWANIYTGDLHLKNERGDYTLIEEPDFLTIRFNKTGKRYKFVLEAVPEMDEELGNFSSGPKG